MAKQPEPRPAPRLYLITPMLASAEAVRSFATKELTEALAAADVAAVLARFATDDDDTLARCIAALAPAIQTAGAALLLDGHANIAARSAADGAHVSGIETLREALTLLKPDRIAGIGGLHARHDAMLAAETGADYVLFGERDGAGERPAFDAIEERIAWWAEIFELPCVGCAAGVDEARALATAGADFILLDDPVWIDPRGLRAALMDALAAIRQDS